MSVHGIQNFYTQAVGKQFLRDFNFRLLNIQTADLSLTSDEIIYATSATLPGRNIVNHQQPFMGLNLNYGGSVQYNGSDSYTVSVFMPADGTMREKLERASRNIFDDNTSTGNYTLPGPENRVVLALIDPQLQILRGQTYTLVGAQLRNVGDITFDYLAGTGALVKCDITLAYQWYTRS